MLLDLIVTIFIDGTVNQKPQKKFMDSIKCNYVGLLPAIWKIMRTTGLKGHKQCDLSDDR